MSVFHHCSKYFISVENNSITAVTSQFNKAANMLTIARRENWTAFSTYKMWQTMLGITTKESRNHNILAETFSTILTSKFTQLLDDMQRVYKKVSLLSWSA